MYSYNIEEYKLEFIKPAITSRNTFDQRSIYLIHLTNDAGKTGIGEAAPLALLSIDDVPEYAEILAQKLDEFCAGGKLENINLEAFPSIQFGLETAIKSVHANRADLFFNTAFTRGEETIPVNGLVWMNDTESMYFEALDKIKQGFKTIKFKVGALDFDQECRMLEKIRKKFSAFEITLRLDANGGFKADEALEQLTTLKRFEIHSIEQPILAQNWDKMAQLCSESGIDIALDEELIGINPFSDGAPLLQEIGPQYLILKPNLIGGFIKCDEWIRLCKKDEIGWWATSALEANVGLNAISQWVSQYGPTMAQGLGTGSLYKNNLDSPLKLKNGHMQFIR